MKCQGNTRYDRLMDSVKPMHRTQTTLRRFRDNESTTIRRNNIEIKGYCKKT